MANNPANQAVIQYTYAGARAPVIRLSNAASSLPPSGAMSLKLTPVSLSFEPCGLVTLLIHVRNDAKHRVKDVRVADVLHGTPELKYLPASAMLFLNGEPAPIQARTPLAFDLPRALEPGDNALILLNASVCGDCECAPLILKASAAVLAIDASTGRPLTASDNVLLTRARSADLSIFKHETDTGFEFVLTNTGSTQAERVRLTDVLPRGFDVQSVEITQNGVSKPLSQTDYTVDDANRLTVPAEDAESLCVPPASDAGPGEVTIAAIRA